MLEKKMTKKEKAIATIELAIYMNENVKVYKAIVKPKPPLY